MTGPAFLQVEVTDSTQDDLHRLASERHRFRTTCALAFVAAFAAMVFTNYAIQTTFVPALAKYGSAGDEPLVGALTMTNPRSLGWALEMWGYALLGVATWLSAPVFSSGALERLTALLFVLNGFVSIATAYAAMRFNNIMDMLQLVFSFVNAPLFATFLLGMFWKRTTGHGAFTGLVAGTGAAAVHYELTAVAGAASLFPKLAIVHAYPSDMAQNFWGAIIAWTTCFVVTAGVSLLTAPKAESDLRGLVYGLAEHSARSDAGWHQRPAVLAAVVLTLTLGLNILFW